MKILICLSMLFSSAAFAQRSAQPGDLDAALDRLGVVFHSARVTRVTWTGGLLWGVVSGAAMYAGLRAWTGSPDLAQRAFNYALFGNIVWTAADRIAYEVMDQSHARRQRPARDYMDREILPDFFRLSRGRQRELARSNRELEQFLLRLDEAIERTAPVEVRPYATPRAS